MHQFFVSESKTLRFNKKNLALYLELNIPLPDNTTENIALRNEWIKNLLAIHDDELAQLIEQTVNIKKKPREVNYLQICF